MPLYNTLRRPNNKPETQFKEKAVIMNLILAPGL
jgi:hypothetical protein